MKNNASLMPNHMEPLQCVLQELQAYEYFRVNDAHCSRETGALNFRTIRDFGPLKHFIPGRVRRNLQGKSTRFTEPDSFPEIFARGGACV